MVMGWIEFDTVSQMLSFAVRKSCECFQSLPTHYAVHPSVNIRQRVNSVDSTKLDLVLLDRSEVLIEADCSLSI